MRNEQLYIKDIFNRVLTLRKGNHDLTDNYEKDINNYLNQYGKDRRCKVKFNQNNNFSAIITYRKIQYHVVYDFTQNSFVSQKSHLQ